MKRIISFMITIGMVLSMVMIVSPIKKVYAAGAYSSYIPTSNDTDSTLSDKEIIFNRKTWYIIADNSTAYNSGTVTLLCYDYVYEKCVWDLDGDHVYSGSNVEIKLNETYNTKFANSAIVGVDLDDVGVKGAKFWLLSEEEVTQLPLIVRKGRDCWLRTWSRVLDDDGTIYTSQSPSSGYHYLRPACKIDLSKVAFYTDEKGRKTFALKPDEVKAVETQISALKSADKITTADKDAIEDARKAYDSLTDEQKAMVYATIYKKLTDAETALEEAGKEKKDDKKEDKKDDKNDDKKDGSKGNDKKSSDTGDKGKKYSNEWVDGKWYNADGTQTYNGTLGWKGNATGWWVEDSDGWYPTSSWQKIDGVWYYFKPDGYMAANEYYNGYWFNSDGSWDEQYFLTWKSNATGWWVEDISGWWPSSSWLKIDGYWYYFDASGYMVTSQYIDGWWISSDGVCY
ncbi:MAG: hypothetical protein K5865_05645 [Eubacterium sp.]|nr:hypothetical protein [Eubacterium sp.]